MKFFVLDNQNNICNQIELLKNLSIDVEIIDGMVSNNPIEEYQKDKFDFLVIDSTSNNCLDIFNKIIQIILLIQL